MKLTKLMATETCSVSLAWDGFQHATRNAEIKRKITKLIHNNCMTKLTELHINMHDNT